MSPQYRKPFLPNFSSQKLGSQRPTSPPSPTPNFQVCPGLSDAPETTHAPAQLGGGRHQRRAHRTSCSSVSLGSGCVKPAGAAGRAAGAGLHGEGSPCRRWWAGSCPTRPEARLPLTPGQWLALIFKLSSIFHRGRVSSSPPPASPPPSSV